MDATIATSPCCRRPRGPPPARGARSGWPVNRATTSRLNVDGADFTNNFFGEFFGSLERQNFTIPLEAVQEFEVSAGGLGVQSGRSNGGLVNVVTKSGGNQRHGSLAYSLRHHALTADDAFGNAPVGLVRHIVGRQRRRAARGRPDVLFRRGGRPASDHADHGEVRETRDRASPFPSSGSRISAHSRASTRAARTSPPSWRRSIT